MQPSSGSKHGMFMHHQTACKLTAYHVQLFRLGMATLLCLQLPVCPPYLSHWRWCPVRVPLNALVLDPVHAPQVCRTWSERGRINTRDPCSSLKSSPPSGLNPFSRNSTIRKEMWMNARWSNILECNPSIRGKYLKIKTPFTQKSFFTVVFCLEDLLMKVLGKYCQGWKMEKNTLSTRKSLSILIKF